MTSPVLLTDPDRLEACLRSIPTEPGVYFMRDKQGEII